MSTHPAFMADAFDDLLDDAEAAEVSVYHDELLEHLEILRANAPSMADFEALFGKVDAAHLPSVRGCRHDFETVDDLYNVNRDDPHAKAARRMRKIEGV